MFDKLVEEAIAAYDWIIGPDLSEVAWPVNAAWSVRAIMLFVSPR